MDIIQKLYDDNNKDFNNIKRPVYIGITKRCCADCSHTIEQLNKKFPGLIIEEVQGKQRSIKLFEIRGAHKRPYTWAIPPFVIELGLDILTPQMKEQLKRTTTIEEEAPETSESEPEIDLKLNFSTNRGNSGFTHQKREQNIPQLEVKSPSSNSKEKVPGKVYYTIPGDGDCLFNSILVAYVDAHHGSYPTLNDRTSITNQSKLRGWVADYYEHNFEAVQPLLKQVLIDVIKIGDFGGLGALGGKLKSIRDNYQSINPGNVDISKYEGGEISDELIREYIQEIKNGSAWGGGQELDVLSQLLGVKIKLSGQQIPFNASGREDAPEIEIRYTGGNHYNVFLSNPSNSTVSELLQNVGGISDVSKSIISEDHANMLGRLGGKQFQLILQIIFNKREVENIDNEQTITEVEIKYAIDFLEQSKFFHSQEAEIDIAQSSKKTISSSRNIDSKDKTPEINNEIKEAWETLSRFNQKVEILKEFILSGDDEQLLECFKTNKGEFLGIKVGNSNLFGMFVEESPDDGILQYKSDAKSVLQKLCGLSSEQHESNTGRSDSSTLRTRSLNMLNEKGKIEGTTFGFSPDDDSMLSLVESSNQPLPVKYSDLNQKQEKEQFHQLALQQLREPAQGINAQYKDGSNSFRGGSWAVAENSEVKDLAEKLDITINIISMTDRFSSEDTIEMKLAGGLNFTGAINSINPNGKNGAVYIVLSDGQYNPMLNNTPESQGKSKHNIEKKLTKLIVSNSLEGLEWHPNVRDLRYRQLEENEHNNNCFYFALAECLVDQDIKNQGKTYTADSLKGILADHYKNFDDPHTQEWLKSIPVGSTYVDDDGQLKLGYMTITESVEINKKDKDSISSITQQPSQQQERQRQQKEWRERQQQYRENSKQRQQQVEEHLKQWWQQQAQEQLIQQKIQWTVQRATQLWLEWQQNQNQLNLPVQQQSQQGITRISVEGLQQRQQELEQRMQQIRHEALSGLHQQSHAQLEHAIQTIQQTIPLGIQLWQQSQQQLQEQKQQMQLDILRKIEFKWRQQKSGQAQHLKRSEKSAAITQENLVSYNLGKKIKEASGSNQEIVEKYQQESRGIAVKEMHGAITPLATIEPKGNIKLMPEIDHGTQHSKNAEQLIPMIKAGELDSSTVICLERKQEGSNLGMPDVIMLAGILKHNETAPEPEVNLPSWLKRSAIYKDAELYNAAKENGITVVGVEGKGLKYTEEFIKTEQQKANAELEKLQKEKEEISRSKAIPEQQNRLDGLDKQLQEQKDKFKRISELANQIPGIIGKDIGKESVLYNVAREGHMAQILEQIANTGKNVIFPVGDTHKENLKTALTQKGIIVEAGELPKAVTKPVLNEEIAYGVTTQVIATELDPKTKNFLEATSTETKQKPKKATAVGEEAIDASVKAKSKGVEEKKEVSETSSSKSSNQGKSLFSSNQNQTKLTGMSAGSDINLKPPLSSHALDRSKQKKQTHVQQLQARKSKVGPSLLLP